MEAGRCLARKVKVATHARAAALDLLNERLGDQAVSVLLLAGEQDVLNGADLELALVLVVLEAQLLAHLFEAALTEALVGPAAMDELKRVLTLGVGQSA